MSYRSYDAVDCNQLNREELAEAVEDEWTIVAVDAAKKRPYAVVYTVDRGASRAGALVEEEVTFRWEHPVETNGVIEMLDGWSAEQLEVVMEPSGSYFDGFVDRIEQLQGAEMRRMRGKKVRDSKENYDNVPSIHDAKAADVMARVHLGGGSRPWRSPSERQRRLKAAIKRADRLKDQRERERNRLEGELGSQWPAVSQQLSLTSTTLLELIVEFGTPGEVARQPEEARALMARSSRGQVGPERRSRIVARASRSAGRKPCREEQKYLQEIAERLLELKGKIREAERRIEELIDGDDVAERLEEMVGPLAAAALVGEVGDPRDFDAAAAYEKAAGLNLVEDTSGQEGQHTEADESPPMRISKRGSSRARKYLYQAAQRWIQWCPVAGAWYQHKVAQHGGCDAPTTISLVALMRKLIRVLYHIGRGAEYDASEAFDRKRLVERGYAPETV